MTVCSFFKEASSVHNAFDRESGWGIYNAVCKQLHAGGYNILSDRYNQKPLAQQETGDLLNKSYAALNLFWHLSKENLLHLEMIEKVQYNIYIVKTL